MNNILLSSTYFGPVQWYQKLAHGGVCLVERHDHFIKQTYRNRCVIATTQGPQALTVPVESPQGLRIDKTEMKDVRPWCVAASPLAGPAVGLWREPFFRILCR